MSKEFTPEELSRKTEKELLELQVQIAHETYKNINQIKGNVAFIYWIILVVLIIMASGVIMMFLTTVTS